MRGRLLLGLLGMLAACPGKERPRTELEPVPPAERPGAEAEAEPTPAQKPITAPVVVPAATEAHAAVQELLHGDPLPTEPRVHFVPVEDPPGADALAGFHRALTALQAGNDPDGKVRVVVYGSSSVAADRYTAYLRGYLQHRFGDAGIGFVAIVPLWRWHRHNEVSAKGSKHWEIEHAQRKKGRLDGYYGLLGASAYTTSKRAVAELATRSRGTMIDDPAASTFLELYYLAQPDGGRFRLEVGVDNDPTVSTKAATFEPGYDAPAFEGSPMPVRIRPVGDGEVRLFGAVLETDGPGIVVDTLGIGGTRAANALLWDEAIWADNLRRRDPSLVLLAYGANESVDEDEPMEVYRENLVAVLERLRRAVPGASCVLVGPADFPLEDETGQWVTRPRLDAIVDAQREISGAHGCGFWDVRDLQGGPGGMDVWVTGEPALAKGDHLHFTPLGYLYEGRSLADALLAGFDRSPPEPAAP